MNSRIKLAQLLQKDAEKKLVLAKPESQPTVPSFTKISNETKETIISAVDTSSCSYTKLDLTKKNDKTKEITFEFLDDNDNSVGSYTYKCNDQKIYNKIINLQENFFNKVKTKSSGDFYCCINRNDSTPEFYWKFTSNELHFETNK
uniref:Uncharacterized protein n=1 Tax=viral metagenome TaxID=1070528 RepID=A0A6C0F2L0_9ZZZZ